MQPGREQTIIIVAPRDAVVRVVRRTAGEAVVFVSQGEFEKWLAEHAEIETIRPEVMRALEQVACRPGGLPRRLRGLIEWLSERPRAPKLSELERQCPSRRSLYRLWGDRIAETPSAFLRRVRALHAARLLASGVSRKQAAATAGFSSVDMMRRHVRTV